MDAYNLTWKLALVLQGKMEPKVLQTYNTERKKIAEDLLEFDRKFAHHFGKKEFLDNNEQFHDIYEKALGFTTGIGLRYEQNVLIDYNVDVPVDNKSLEFLTPGKRLYAPTVVRHIVGSATSVLDDIPSNVSISPFPPFLQSPNAGMSQEQAKHLLSAVPYPLHVHYNTCPFDEQNTE